MPAPTFYAALAVETQAYLAQRVAELDYELSFGACEQALTLCIDRVVDAYRRHELAQAAAERDAQGMRLAS